MKTHTITKSQKMPDWSEIDRIEIDYAYKTTATDIKAFAQLSYSDTELFVHLCAVEKNIRAEEKIPYGEPCRDSCLEFFFSPVNGKPDYFNIEFSPTGCMYLGLGSSLNDLLRIVPDYTENLFSHKIGFTSDGWEIEYTIPFSFIRKFFPDFAPEKGGYIMANFYKCGDLTVSRHYLEWNPVESDPFTFHKPECFGKIIFG